MTCFWRENSENKCKKLEQWSFWKREVEAKKTYVCYLNVYYVMVKFFVIKKQAT